MRWIALIDKFTFIPHSPSPEEGMGDEFDLMDHSDLYILDFST